MARNKKNINFEVSPAFHRAWIRLLTAESLQAGRPVKTPEAFAEAVKKTYPDFKKLYNQELEREKQNVAA